MMTKQHAVERVLVTGMDAICCVGSGLAALRSGMRRADSQLSPAPDPHANMTIRHMHVVPPECIPAQPDQVAGREIGATGRLAVHAARRAVADSGMDAVPPDRTAVVLGSGLGAMRLHEEWRAVGFPGREWTPAFSVAAAVGADLGATGRSIVISNACAASGYAITIAADLIRSREADVVITGGAESYARVALAAFNRLGAFDPERCRPFAAARAGTVFGEGAAVLVLESDRHAASRQAPRRYAELAGVGWSCDAYHNTAPEPDGTQIARAIRQALANGNGTDAAVGCVIPHGTGTVLNDVIEAETLKQLLGKRIDTTPCYSLKALIGHTGGAAAAFGVLAASLILSDGVVPPNVEFGIQDDQCPLWLPAKEATPLTDSSVLVNAYAFGGNNVSLLLKEMQP